MLIYLQATICYIAVAEETTVEVARKEAVMIAPWTVFKVKRKKKEVWIRMNNTSGSIKLFIPIHTFL